jgi:hypothetical protein
MGILSRGAFSDTDSNPSAALSVTPFTRHRALNLHLHGYLEPEESESISLAVACSLWQKNEAGEKDHRRWHQGPERCRSRLCAR